MRLVALAAGGTIALVLGAPAGASAAARPAPQDGNGAAAHQAVLQRYCVPCHNERNRANAGGLTLAAADLARIGESAAVWEQVVVKLRAASSRRRPRRFSWRRRAAMRG